MAIQATRKTRGRCTSECPPLSVPLGAPAGCVASTLQSGWQTKIGPTVLSKTADKNYTVCRFLRPLSPRDKPPWQSSPVYFSGQPFTCLAGLGKCFLNAAQLLNSARGGPARAEMPTPHGSSCQEAKRPPGAQGPAHSL